MQSMQLRILSIIIYNKSLIMVIHIEQTLCKTERKNKVSPQQSLHQMSSAMAVFLIILCLPTQSFCQKACMRLFPRVIGGNQGDTDATMLDFYQPTEHLSIIGSTVDSDVAGQSLTMKQAYLAMFQGPSMNLEWIKSFPDAQEVRSVAFSSDGSLLLIQASSESLLNIIISARVTNGDLINAFSYSNQIGKLDFTTRNLLFQEISGTYNAIFQAPYLSGGGSVSGFIILGHAFTLAAPGSLTQLLGLRSLIYASSDDLPLGLAQSPQDSSCIYSFSQQGISLSGDKYYKIARVKISGSIEQFTYEIQSPSDVDQQSQAIDVAKNAAPNQEVVFIGIASLSHQIKIGRLIVDTASVSVTSSQVIQDDSHWSGARISALKIVNENQVSLLAIKDFKMYILSHDYSSMSSTGQQMLPPLTQDVLRLSRFVSQYKFYALSVGTLFNVDEMPSSSSIGSKKHAILLDSDDKQGCYSGSAAASISKTLVLNANAFSAASTASFESTPTINLVPTPLTLSMTDYDPTRVTSIDSSCSATSGPFVLNSVVQMKSTFEYFAGKAQTFVIQPFSASQTCASQAPAFTYIGFDDTMKRLLRPSDFITVDPSNGAISVTSAGTVGTTVVKVLGRVQSGQQLVETFTLVGGKNSAPFFQSPLENQTVAIMSKLIYILPAITDIENDQVTLTAFKTIGGAPLPSFITTTLNKVVINPTSFTEVGSLLVTLRLDDSINKADFSFKVVVTNLPPKLDDGQAFMDITIDQLSNQMYPIPNYSDPEGLLATIVVVEPSFVTVYSSSKLRIQPSSVQLSKYVTVSIKIQDGEPKATTYTFTIEFSNVAPQYSLTPQFVAVFHAKPYQILITELEGDQWTISFESSPILANSFVSLTNDTFSFSPNSYEDVGTYLITVTVVDSNKYSNVQSFQLTVTNDPPVFASILDSVLHIHLGQDFYYNLPSTHDQEGKSVVVSLVSPPSFVSLPSQSQLKVSTGELTGLNTYSVDLELSDGSVNQTSYSMSLVVGNCAPTLKSPLGDQTVSVFQKSIKTLQFIDIDNDLLTFSMTPVLPFVSISGQEMTIYPNNYSYIGFHSLTVIATDNGTLSGQETFVISVINMPPIFVDSAEPKTIDFEYLKTSKYVIPDIMDPEGQPITITVESLPQIMSQDSPTTFTVKTSYIEDIRDYQLKIKLQDGEPKSTQYTIPIRIMSPPLFLQPIKDPKVRLMTENLVDLNIKHPRNLSFTTKLSGQSVALEFISLISSNSLLIGPFLPAHIGIHSIQLKAIGQDSLFILKTIIVTVFNDPPMFSDKRPQNQRIRMNKVASYQLPDFQDLEHQEVFVEHTRIPPFCKFSGQTYTCEPIKEVGIFEVFGYLSDGLDKSPFMFTIEVYNTAPFFKEKLLGLRLVQGEPLSYHLPQPEDEEGQKIKITVKEKVTQALPEFIQFHADTRTIIFSPLYQTKAQKYLIEVILSDSIAPEAIYSLTVEIFPASQHTQEIKTAASNLTQSGRIKCTYVGRDSRVILKISPTSESLMQHLANNSFTVSIIGKGQAQYQIIQKDANSGEITLGLLLKEHLEVSTGTDPDMIEVVLNHRFEEPVSNKLIVFNKGLKVTRSIPPQVSQSMKSIAQTLEGGKVNIFESTTSNFVLSIGIQFIWSFLFDISFITINTMISMPVPGIIQILQQVFLNLIYADLLMTEKWLPKIFSKGKNSQIDEGGINSFFEENGFESYDLIRNLGSNFVYFALYLAILSLFSLFRLLSLVFTSLTPIRAKCDLWMLSLTNMVINSQLPPLSLSAMINLYQLSYETTLQKVSSALSIAISVLIPMALIASMILLRSYESENVKKMVEGQNTATVTGKYWQVIVNLRWIITNAVMVSLREWYVFQIQILLILSIIAQCLMILGHPLKSHFDNYFSLVLEFGVSCYLYVLLSLSDFQGVNNTDLRDRQGWALAILTMLVVGTNTLIFLVKKASSTFLYIKQLILKRREQQRTIALKPVELPMWRKDNSDGSSRNITAMDVNEYLRKSDKSQSESSFEVKNYYQRKMPVREVTKPFKYYSRVLKQKPQIEDSQVNE